MSRETSLDIRLARETPAPAPLEAVALCIFSGEPYLSPSNAGGVEASLRQTCGQLLRDGEFKGEDGDALLVYAASARRRLLVGRARGE